MKKDLYVALRTALSSSTQIRWVDWQKGQFSAGAQSTTLPLPAVLIDFKTSNGSTASWEQQEGNLRLYVDVYMPYYEPLSIEAVSDIKGISTTLNTNAETQAQTLALLDTLDEVFHRLQGFQYEGLQGLSRVKEERILWSDEANILAYRLEFRSRIYQRLEQNIQSHHILNWNAHDTFLNTEELKTAAPQALLNSLSAGQEDLLQQLALENIDRISSYLQGRYDAKAIFSARGDTRSAIILKYLKDLVVHDLLAAQSHGQVGETVRRRHEEAISWLEQIGQGRLSPDLPRRDQSTTPGLGSKPRYTHRYLIPLTDSNLYYMSQSSSSFMSQANTSSKLHIRKYIFDFLGNLGLLHRSSAQATPEPSKNKNTRVHVEIQKQDISKYRREIEHWQLARNLRYRTQEPLSHALQEVFTDAMLDTHLSAVTTNRILRLQNKRYVLRNANNELQKTRSQWLQRSWFKSSSNT